MIGAMSKHLASMIREQRGNLTDEQFELLQANLAFSRSLAPLKSTNECINRTDLEWGTFWTPDGRFYQIQRDRVTGRLNGHGILIDVSHGCCTEGHWVDDKLSGLTRSFSADKWYFEGQKLNGKMHGKGIFRGGNG